MVTGQYIDGTPTTIEERTAELGQVYRDVFGDDDDRDDDHHPERHHQHVDVDDAALLDRARASKNGDQFSTLFDRGDISSYASPSEADLALCNHLAFWTGCDAERMAHLFRSSALMRPKWDSRRRDSSYGADTIARAIKDCRETYTGGTMPTLYISKEESDSVPDDPAPETYAFAPVVSEGHFLGRYIRYGDSRTDASHEYHEAVGLALLAAATPTVRAQLSPYPIGLGTNLYGLIIGDSTTHRKSTAKDLGQDIQQRAIPGSLTSDHFSPDGFIEQLASRPTDSMTLFIDEFGELIDKLHHAKHMAGLRGLLMTVYGGGDYCYARRSKRKSGGEMTTDEDQIERPHLSVLGVTTPAIFSILREADVLSGLLPRFGIIMPESKPERRPFHAAGGGIATDRESLIDWLARLHDWSTSYSRRVVFATDVLDKLDTFAAQVEKTAGTQSDVGKVMLARLTPMAVKVAMLIAAGKPETPDRTILDVELEDAEAAITIATRWQSDALTFASRIGESEFERKLDRCYRLVKRRRKVRRIHVARTAKVDRKTLDSIRDTLVDRGQMVVKVAKSETGPNAEWWCAPTGQKTGAGA